MSRSAESNTAGLPAGLPADQPPQATESRPAMNSTAASIQSASGRGAERAVLPTGMVHRTSRLLALPARHAARTVAAVTRLSNATTEQIAARSTEQVFATLGELKGGATKLGQALSVFEAALPEKIATPYRSALSRLADATPAMPATVAHRVLASDLAFAYGTDWRTRLIDFDDNPAATASIGQVHRGRWRDNRGNLIDVAVKVQYPGITKALRSDLRATRMLGRIIARATGLDIAALADEIVTRFVDELDYIREGHVQNTVAAAFARPLPKALVVANAAEVHEPPGRTSVVVPHVYAATPRVLVSTWLDGPPLTALLNDSDHLPSGWRDLTRADAANLAARLIGHAAYAPAACTGWMHADPHPGNFLLLPDQRLGLLDFGSVASMPDGPPEPLGRLAAAVLASDGAAAVQWARQAGALTPTANIDPGLLLELLDPIVAPTAEATFTYSATWLRALITHLTQPRFAGIRREMTTPLEYALVWRGVLSVGGLYAQLGATVPSRGFELAYSPGFRHATNARLRLRSGRPR
jgi:predicted unusual protein kinase regulating ubiquinone biosynthesis (AarF/ABC1/UbiB family)